MRTTCVTGTPVRALLAVGGLLLTAGLLDPRPLAAASATVAHDYQLNASLADALGGPALVSNGGTLTATEYQFGPNQGPSLSGALSNPAEYSIEMRLKLDDTAGWRKMIDFKDRASDNGFYSYWSQLNFYPFVYSGASDVSPGVYTHVVLTRDAATKQVLGYAGGVQRIDFVDLSDDAVFTAPGNLVHWFRDDFATGQTEATPGAVDFIRIYTGVLTPAQVASLAGSGPPPPPPTVACVPNPNILWPPNHQLVDVTISVTTGGGSGPTSVTLQSVASNEPDNGLGDGDTPADVQGWSVGTADFAGQLRAERSGTGSGRTYSLTYQVADTAGGTASCTVAVNVPRDRRS